MDQKYKSILYAFRPLKPILYALKKTTATGLNIARRVTEKHSSFSDAALLFLTSESPLGVHTFAGKVTADALQEMLSLDDSIVLQGMPNIQELSAKKQAKFLQERRITAHRVINLLTQNPADDDEAKELLNQVAAENSRFEKFVNHL